jgi:hypothetical protein
MSIPLLAAPLALPELAVEVRHVDRVMRIRVVVRAAALNRVDLQEPPQPIVASIT